MPFIHPVSSHPKVIPKHITARNKQILRKTETTNRIRSSRLSTSYLLVNKIQGLWLE
jgi:hypothetical protein